MALSQARLRELLDYNPKSGVFTWRRGINERVGRGGMTRAGRIAGCIDKRNGKHRIGIDGKFYVASRLAFFWITKRWPVKQMDHINGNCSDNRWSNLRQATSHQNNANRKKLKRVLFKGIKWQKANSNYQASIQINYHRIHLGVFDTAEDAHAAYVEAAKRYFGEFARAG